MKQKIAEYWLNRHQATQINLTQMVESAMQEFSDQQNATLIAEHRLMKETLEKAGTVNGMGMPILSHRESIDLINETLKNITL